MNLISRDELAEMSDDTMEEGAVVCTLLQIFFRTKLSKLVDHRDSHNGHIFLAAECSAQGLSAYSKKKAKYGKPFMFCSEHGRERLSQSLS